MDEYFSHQANASDEQTQGESLSSPSETESQLPAVQTPLAPSPSLPPVPSRRNHSRRIVALVIGLLVLLLVGTGGSVYAAERTQIPGASAAIHITPDNQQLSKTYSTNVIPNATDSSLNPIGAHTISMTSSAKSLTIQATGSQQVPATYATGLLRLGDGSSVKPIPAGSYAIRSNSGVDIEFYINSPIPTNTNPDVSAQAMNPGPSGNIKKYDVYGTYDFPNNTSIIVLNYQPFSGGRNGYTITAVSQNDIDRATTQLTLQLQNGLAADQAALKSELAPSEQLLDPANIQCKPSVKANRHANDQASDVTATGTMTCSTIAYTPARLQEYGAGLLAKDAYAQWNGSYALVGAVQEKVEAVSQAGKALTFTLDVQGRYRLQLNPDLAVHLASLVAGKTQAEAQIMLLQQTGISKVTIQVSGGLGTALPASPKDISITIL